MSFTRQSGITAAYRTLGLNADATGDQVKVAYRQLALLHHPDKNPDNVDATAKFQEISHAYDVIQTHLSRPKVPHPFATDFDDVFAYDDDEDDEDDDDDFYDDADDVYLHFFYMFLFEEAMNDRFAAHKRFRRETQERHEIPKQDTDRLRRQREAQEMAARRRQEEATRRKERAERDRELERQAAEQRQKAKAADKKAKLEAERQKAAEKVLSLAKMVQTTRSKVFAAARASDAPMVRKGIWEENVDPTGGEVKAGSEQFAPTTPRDALETLLHIAARNGDSGLVEWLDAHSADPEERNSHGLTPFHVALHCGHIPIVSHFLENYPPAQEESSNVYSLPGTQTVLSLAVQSREPEVVYFILQSGLAPSSHIQQSWDWMLSAPGREHMQSKTLSRETIEKVDDIGHLLVQYGGLKPPSVVGYSNLDPAAISESGSSQSRSHSPPFTDKSLPSRTSHASTKPSQPPTSTGGRRRGKGRGRR